MIQGEITYEFSDNGVHVTGDLFETKYKWGAIYMVEEFKEWLLIYTSRQTAIHLYKPDFEQSTDLPILKNIVNSHNHIYTKFKS